MRAWTPDSWRSRTARQMPRYPDRAALLSVEQRLAAAAPVAAIAESAALRERLAVLGGGFILQGGDCAESFDDRVAERVAGLTDLFDAMAAALSPALGGAPLVEIARLAGQFAKPRSLAEEWQDGAALPAYRGDIVNSPAFAAAARAADPERMMRAHMQSVGTAACLAAARASGRAIHASHEALLLPYEQALTRQDEAGRWWATSGHMLWLGDRTRQLDGAHVEYLRGIENAVGIKCGPDLMADDLLRLVERLDPANRPGKLLLIGRFGAGRIAHALPPLLRASRSSGLRAHWMIDPMHGNTENSGARKIRRVADILDELDRFFAICSAEAVAAAGVHLEMTPDSVTECLGGRGPGSVGELEANWQSRCDPRLNREQALDLAEHLARRIAPLRALSA